MKTKIVRGYVLISILLMAVLATTFVYHFELLQVSFYPMVKHIEKARVLKYTEDFKTFETEYFIIRYEKEDEEYAKLTGSIADKYYESICDMYKYYPSSKSDIIIYSNEKDFLENLKFDKGNTPIGVYYSGTINILSPKIWINDTENLNEIYEFNGPVIHEFAHLLIDDITRGNYPMWLTEGLALYTEYKTTGFEWQNYDTVDYKVTLDDLDKRFDDINQALAYRKSFEVVKGISDEWGFEKLRHMLDILGEGSNINQSARAVLKTNLFELKSFD
ncbi:peptidase MA family metallohydrolase [Proteiniborus sp. MB09-C3]|uniref:peptidase MA family metallohydrolase n=1 Tax=Proteiniborus sp. MB09-C3 TaxID=3050072 RepID=UPI0025576557|nr:peptidase MA family metallohydrolase [Proteiniborus sp. MB09-C3]WIV12509.1 peptidase MA family metallohydrolase [Proteiniborus sp. MB09-C3]